uniref:Uncharacterized protein n=1 Tax=Arundo donax TaxID=35708 RepID=A0A0A8YTQ7_ARUDO
MGPILTWEYSPLLSHIGRPNSVV